MKFLSLLALLCFSLPTDVGDVAMSVATPVFEDPVDPVPPKVDCDKVVIALPRSNYQWNNDCLIQGRCSDAWCMRNPAVPHSPNCTCQ